ncbi:MAG: ferrous iron transport protein B, partial [Clostridia bacterium]|nr:ferrous iron transport protein B [Clostridia bacterium]
MYLNELEIGNSAVVISVGGEGALRQHFLDMGVIPGAIVTAIKLAPMGDPLEIRIHGYEMSMRLDDAAKIEINEDYRIYEEEDRREHDHIHNIDFDNDELHKHMHEPGQMRDHMQEHAYYHEYRQKMNIPDTEMPHPGLGEEGKYHTEGDANRLPEGTLLTFALAGNQNCGKTTLFNQLTGANQHVGNFPGVTVSRKDGAIRGHAATLVTDLPGIYSMSPYTNEEIVSRNFILRDKPRAIINIVDATNIERNMYLTLQLMEMNIPMVVALNMMDELRGNGGSVNINEMEALLGVPVVPISAAKNEGVDELVAHALHVARYQETPLVQDFCDEYDHKGAVHRCIHAVIHLIEDHAQRIGIPVRFAASKVIEGDKLILEELGLDLNEKEMLEHIISQMETERNLDRSAAIADMRFTFIKKVCQNTVIKPGVSKEHERSRRIDSVLTGKYTAIPSFAAIMVLIFWLTFDVVGAWLQNLFQTGITSLSVATDAALTAAGVNSVIHGLIIDGIFTGIGSVLSFLPVIVTLFFFLSILEDSGYIARVAFFMDKLLRKIGLSGRSIVPMLIGFGCTVPAVMATRTLPSERDRRMTILLTPFMSCSAKLPIYAFFVSAFFPEHGGLVMSSLYILGIAVGIVIALLYRNTLFKGSAVPFVMELPNYRFPSAGNVIRLLWEKAKDFLQRAFSVIMIATIVVWFLQSFDIHLNFAENSQDSILAIAAGVLAPLFIPLGIGDWRIVTSLLTGFMAKESVVSTIQVLFGSAGGIETALTTLSAASLLVFSLLYTPCVAAVASVNRELGRKWAVAVV